MGLQEFFGPEFAEKYKKFERKHYEPLKSEEVEEIKKQARYMTPDSARAEWKGYDIILASSPDSMEKLRSTTVKGNERVVFFWKGEWLSAFLPTELAEKIETSAYYLLVGRLKEKEWQGNTSYSMSVNEAIPIGRAEETKTQEIPIEIPSQELINRVEKAANLLGEEKLTPKWLKEMGIVETGTSDTLVQKAIDKIKKQKPTTQATPAPAPSSSMSPELQMTINKVKEAFSILGYDGFTLQAVKALGLVPETQDKVLERIMERVKKGEL